MFSVSSFELNLNTSTGVFSVISDEEVPCPSCGGLLAYRCTRLRGLKNLIGEIRRFLLRRFYCKECKTTHTEIPDIIQPYKHYDTEAIQCVLDCSEAPAGCAADDSTIRRWKKTFAEAEPDLTQRLASVFAQMTDGHVPLESAPRTFNTIRARHSYWLPFVMGLLINSGHKLRARFAFCPPNPASTIASAGKNEEERGAKCDKTIDDTS